MGEMEKRKMERYNYLQAITDDVITAIKDNYTPDDIRERLTDRDEWAQQLNDDLWIDDSVTGNASGSYFCNAWRAEECICHNLELLAEACEEFGSNTDLLTSGAEACDVTIRCYLLNQAIHAALDELEDEQ